MPSITKAQLQAEVEALRHNNEMLRTQLESAQAEIAAFKQPARRVSIRPAAKVFEFDPSINGDFVRASKLAREFGGMVRRVQAH